MLPIQLSRDGLVVMTWGVLEPGSHGIVLPLGAARKLGCVVPEGTLETPSLTERDLSIEIASGDGSVIWNLKEVWVADIHEARLGWHGFLQYFDIQLLALQEVFNLSPARALPT
jgi:hypothetical protein